MRNIQPNKQSPKLEVAYELWSLNDEGGWNKEPIDSTNPDAVFEVFLQRTRVMPNCPCKLMQIREVVGT